MFPTHAHYIRFLVIWSYWCFNCQSDRRERCFYTQISVVDNTLRDLTRQNLKSLFRDLSEISRRGGGGEGVGGGK